MKKILIVEDDKLLANALKTMFEANGFTCKIALEGYYAIQYTFQEKPDLVLTDIGLPAGDGFKVIKTLRDSAELMNTPVIIMTGKTDLETMDRIKALGVTAFFTKPFDHKQLLETVKKELGIQ